MNALLALFAHTASASDTAPSYIDRLIERTGVFTVNSESATKKLDYTELTNENKTVLLLLLSSSVVVGLFGYRMKRIAITLTMFYPVWLILSLVVDQFNIELLQEPTSSLFLWTTLVLSFVLSLLFLFALKVGVMLVCVKAGCLFVSMAIDALSLIDDRIVEVKAYAVVAGAITAGVCSIYVKEFLFRTSCALIGSFVLMVSVDPFLVFGFVPMLYEEYCLGSKEAKGRQLYCLVYLVLVLSMLSLQKRFKKRAQVLVREQNSSKS